MKYQKFNKEKDFSDVDHIVIGSGIGGLTAAVWLAKAGKKVVVFEKHYVPGGFTHCFKRKKGFKWDVGVHYVGNVGQEGSLRKLFDFLTAKKLDWEPIGDVYDIVQIGSKTYEIKAGRSQFIAQMILYFPEEIEAINAYVKLIEKVNRVSSAFFIEKSFEPFLSKTIGWFIKKYFHKYSQQTTLSVLEGLTSNKELIAVLCGQCGNYGLSPDQSSFAAHALVIKHFMDGGYYPKGGADKIPKHAIKTLISNGGELYINANVTAVLVEKNKVKGVTVNGQFITCSSVISNIGVQNTFTHLLPQNLIGKLKIDFNDVKPSSGHMCLYVGLDQSNLKLNLPKYNIWNYPNNDIKANYNPKSLNEASANFTYISFPSAKDSEWQKTNPNTATIQALTVGKYEWFSDYENQPWMNRAETYKQMKLDFEKQMLEKLYRLFPQIKGHVLVTEVSTPLSTKHFSSYQKGEIYGLAHTPKRFLLPFLKPETKIKGLRLVGQDITLVGVSAAMLSGMLCAITILKYRVWRIFKQMNA